MFKSDSFYYFNASKSVRTFKNLFLIVLFFDFFNVYSKITIF